MKSLFTPLLAAMIPAILLAEAGAKPTPEEVADYQRKLFAYLDADSDGKMTRKEFVVVALYDVFTKQDKDSDGRLTRKEFIDTFREETDAEAEWAMMDTDRDGVILFRDVFRNKNAVSEMEAEFKTIDTLKRGYVTLAQVQAEDS